MKKIVTISLAVAATVASLQAATNAELEERIEKLEKKQTKTSKKLNTVKAKHAGDNVKFGIEFRNAVDSLSYKNNETGEEATNNSLYTSRLYLDMAAAPVSGLIFKGRLAVYSMWGAHLYVDDNGLKDWSGSSKPTDTVLRIKEAYFVYSYELGEQPVSFSVGRRPSTKGFLANMRQNEGQGSPLAHITNMEVNGAMVKLSWDRFMPGAYTKFVFGRAHTGEVENVYGLGSNPWAPYGEVDGDDKNVDFFVMPGSAYNDGQYEIMYQWAHIFNSKGLNIAQNNAWIDAGKPLDMSSGKKAAAGTADLFSVGLKVSGIGDGISDFLDETTFFVSGAYTNYSAKAGYSFLGSEDGGSQSGSSIWAGIIIPDMITENGKIGFEYNHGSKYWTPMTWAEDTAMGSKIAVRGDAYEAYWNFDLFGVKYLPSQIRYTYAQHDYTPNVNCAGWIESKKVDITAQDIRFFITYSY
ncbi:MAG: DUF3373 family protein [Campylobacterota bacterium]|nr:DUF3373 family protein [Campylobacterota bacterium]